MRYSIENSPLHKKVRELSEVTSGLPVSDGDGVRLTRIIGSVEMNTVDPFLLFDSFESEQPNDYIGGFPNHPHRGFETVTYLLDGRMKHEDSAGNKGELNPGDVQWMTAGRGIIHSELPHDEFQKTGGRTHGFQIWVNLPSEHKMMSPRYQEVPATESPTIEKDGVWARVIAGECLGVSSSIDTVIPITLIHVKMEDGTKLNQQIESQLNSMIFVFSGKITVFNETRVKEYPHVLGLGVNQQVRDGELALLSEGPEVEIHSNGSSELLILAGPELNEPISRYGPFVMNTKEEIEQAFEDYRNGTFAN